MSDYAPWLARKSIAKEHTGLPIQQIYLWIITQDNKVAIVSKDKKNYQFPGGKPKEGETTQDTIQREILEETGLTPDVISETPNFFGYYVVSSQKGTFLQVRYLLKTTLQSKSFALTPKENPVDPDPIVEAKWVELEKLPVHIPWIEGLEEYEIVKKLS